MLRAVRVYGPLAKFLKRRVFRAEVSTPAEAVRFLMANFPGVEQHMYQYDYKIKIGKSTLELGKTPEFLHLSSDIAEDISIIPVVAGAGGGTGQILAGVGLIALAVVTGGIASAGVALGGFMGIGTVGTAVVAVGASLVLGGVAQLLTPAAQELTSTGADSASDPRKSYSFSGVQNTSRQGTPVPVIYGEALVGSIVISAGISTEKVSA